MTNNAKTHTFQRDGAFVLVKPVKPVEDRKLTNKDVVELVHLNRDNVANGENTIKEAEQARVRAEKDLQVAKDTLKELEEHYDWSLKIQQSRLKALCEEKHEEAVEKVNSSYKDDPTLTADQNLRQKFVQYRGYMATNQQIRDEIASDVIKDKLFVNCELKNPWL